MRAYEEWPSGNAAISVPVATVWATPDAPRPMDHAILGTEPRIERWLSTMGTVERLDLMGRVVTQAVMGEPVIAVAERNGWTEVRLPWQPTSLDPLGYPGWIPSHQLAPQTEPTSPPGSPGEHLDATQMVHARLLMAQDGKVLSIGSVVHSRHDDVHAGHPHADLRSVMLHHAAQFLGVAYLWGGMSGWGVDCSALVHLSARAAGVLIPRDARDQFSAAEKGLLTVDSRWLRWFAHPPAHPHAGTVRHVGLALDGGRMLHAPRTGFVVEIIDEHEEPYRSDAVTPHPDGS